MNASGTPTVLVVEDDPGIAELEKSRLEEAGYQVLLAATAHEAMAQIHSGRVDLIVLDYHLPGGEDGLSFYARVKMAGHDVPVILVTGFGSEATVIHALRAGVHDFVTKSVEYLDYLPEAVGRVLRQVRTEHQLAESEAMLACVIRSAKDAILVADDRRRVTLFNEAAERMFRCPATEAIGQPLVRFLPPDFATAPGAPDAPGERPESLTQRVRSGSRGVRADGEEFPVEATASRVEAGGRKFYTVVVRDVTERNRLEAQLRQAQKMEAIGQLAGGVAHDFNNLLTIINGYSEVLLDWARPEDARGRELLGEIRKAGARAAALTGQLLAFSRQQVVAPKVLDLNAVVAGIEGMLRRLIGEDVLLRCVLDPGLGRVLADAGQVEQVLLNLAVNARDAMTQGGRLTIETCNVELSAGDPNLRPEARPGRYVLLAVTDTGCGMDEATRAHIFEPFFTTKEPGKGTGLGLATVYGIVKQAGGYVYVYSEPGLGTAFKVYFPREDDAREPVVAAPPAPVRGSETVLVVEDERAVREFTAQILRTWGYAVLVAEDGLHALRLAERDSGPIDLLVTDVVMPRMGGRALAQALQAVRPGLKVLYVSGYTNDAVVRQGILTAEVALLQKPFGSDDLARKVREVLDRGPARPDGQPLSGPAGEARHGANPNRSTRSRFD